MRWQNIAKPIPRISSCKNRHISSRKNMRRIPKGVIHVQGTRRGTPFTTQTAAGNAIRIVVDQGPGLGRDAALRAIRRSGILLSFIRDVSPMPHNGCRPPKKRRV
ncbi:hypothetical protein UlMin_019276 [Ulmus minor]